jgi:pimeloyl-ACP methyl ester carboxylesterase
VTSKTTQTTTHTLDVPGATLTYDVRRNDASTEPILVLIGSPMGAAGFGTLSQHFSDRTVVTHDPRGVERSIKADPTSPATPDVHADDLHRLIQAIGGPVDLFASSGGAVDALALMSKHPEDVRSLVAHEPPLASVLPDREHALAATTAVHETYQRSGWAGRHERSLSRIDFSRARSLRFARFIAPAIAGATMVPNPEGRPRLRSSTSVAPLGVSEKV